VEKKVEVTDHRIAHWLGVSGEVLIPSPTKKNWGGGKKKDRIQKRKDGLVKRERMRERVGRKAERFIISGQLKKPKNPLKEI